MSDGDQVSIKGRIRCSAYRVVEWPPRSGKTHTETAREYELPAHVVVRCKGEGDARRCTAVFPECPQHVREADPIPTAPERRRIAGLRPPTGVTRGRDNSGQWNSEVEWTGREGYTGDRNERGRESFSLHVWDDKPGERTLFYGGSAFRRPYPRADLRLEHEGWHMNPDQRALKAAASVVREAAARGVGRHGHLTRDELRSSPPITVGGERIDWPRDQGGALGGRRRRR